eukprot:2727133-Pleurochrysis_carterae.AAC.2
MISKTKQNVIEYKTMTWTTWERRRAPRFAARKPSPQLRPGACEIRVGEHDRMRRKFGVAISVCGYVNKLGSPCIYVRNSVVRARLSE